MQDNIPEFEILHDPERKCLWIKCNIAGIKIITSFLDEYAKKNVNWNFHEDLFESTH
jgi:hypothetical protein